MDIGGAMKGIAQFVSVAAIVIVAGTQAGPSTMRAPILNDQIEAYAAPKLLEHLRADYRKGRLAKDASYFLKVQDYDDSD